MRTFASITLVIALAGCTTEQSCVSRPTDPLCQPIDSGAIDVGHADAGLDTGPMGDAHVPCGGTCPTATHCLESTDTCVACRTDGDCNDDFPVCDTAGDHTCVGCVDEGDCTANGLHCETTTQLCVACLDSAQCPTTTAARCDSGTHACTACLDDGDCAHLTGTTVCAAGLCAQCAATDETACGANSCDPATHACTTTPRASITTCHACVADSECSNATDRCVPMQFMGAPHGSYCLHPVSAGCGRPYTVTTTARMSASGASSEPYCGVDETVTTCEAVVALFDDDACATSADCGAPALDDGHCGTVSGVANRCTYACGATAQCQSGFMCGAMGYCGMP